MAACSLVILQRGQSLLLLFITKENKNVPIYKYRNKCLFRFPDALKRISSSLSMKWSHFEQNSFDKNTPWTIQNPVLNNDSRVNKMSEPTFAKWNNILNLIAGHLFHMTGQHFCSTLLSKIVFKQYTSWFLVLLQNSKAHRISGQKPPKSFLWLFGRHHKSLCLHCNNSWRSCSLQTITLPPPCLTIDMMFLWYLIVDVFFSFLSHQSRKDPKDVLIQCETSLRLCQNSINQSINPLLFREGNLSPIEFPS